MSMASVEQHQVHFAGLKRKEFQGHKSKVHTVHWSPDGKRLASGSTDHTARVWSLDRLSSSHTANGKDSVELCGHTASVDQLGWCPKNNNLLATVSADRSVRFWDLQSLSIIESVGSESENINISWHPDGSLVAVGGKDDSIMFVDTRTWKIQNRHQFTNEINEIAWSPSGCHLFLTTGTGSVDIVEYPSMMLVKTLAAHTSNCYCIEFDLSGRFFAVGSADAVLSLWDYSELACIRTFCRLDWPIRALSFSHDSEFIASASEDAFIDISQVGSGQLVHKLPTTAATNALAWHPSMHLLAYAGDDVDARTGRSNGNIYVFGFPSSASTSAAAPTPTLSTFPAPPSLPAGSRSSFQ